MRYLVVIASLVVGLLGGTTTDSAARGGTRVIISTDLATGLVNGWRAGVSDIDDGLGVGMALADPALDVLGVVAMFGNNDMEPAKVVGDRVIHLMQSDVPVLRGAAVRLSEPATVQLVACPSPPYYKDPDNPCAGHGPEQKTSLDKESAQLWLSPGADPRVKMCTAYASEEAKQQFLDSIFKFVQ